MSKKARRVALYLRVSTGEQTTDNQRQELEAVAQRAGWQIVEVYEDAGISGAKGRNGRPAFDKLLKDATARKFDMIAAWSVDRLGRSLPDLVAFLDEIRSLGCDLYLHQQNVDTSTPAGRALFQMMGVFAEFERSMISERVKAGQARARDRGARFGRPRRGTEDILRLRREGLSIRRIAAELKTSPTTVAKAIREENRQ